MMWNKAYVLAHHPGAFANQISPLYAQRHFCRALAGGAGLDALRKHPMSDAKDNRFYREKPMKSDREFLREIALDIEALHEPRHIYDKIMAHLAAPGVQACDIKAGKPGLILWLNGVFTTDNG